MCNWQYDGCTRSIVSFLLSTLLTAAAAGVAAPVAVTITPEWNTPGAAVPKSKAKLVNLLHRHCAQIRLD
jgi:hypothetical protein